MGDHFYSYPTVIELRRGPKPVVWVRPSGPDPRSRPPVQGRARSGGLHSQIRRSARADR
jgi:hypothetical protein